MRPNKKTRDAMRELEEGKCQRYESLEDMYDKIDWVKMCKLDNVTKEPITHHTTITHVVIHLEGKALDHKLKKK